MRISRALKLLTEQMVSVGTALGLVCLFILLVHLPQRHQLYDIKGQIKDQEEQLSQAKLKTSALLPLSHQVETLRLAVAKFNKRLPARSESEDCLKQVMATLESEKLISEEIRPESPASMPSYSEEPVTIRFRGTFLSICSFLNKLEKITHLTRVKELRLERNRKGEPQIRATMILNIYYNRS